MNRQNLIKAHQVCQIDGTTFDNDRVNTVNTDYI